MLLGAPNREISPEASICSCLPLSAEPEMLKQAGSYSKPTTSSPSTICPRNIGRPGCTSCKTISVSSELHPYSPTLLAKRCTEAAAQLTHKKV